MSDYDMANSDPKPDDATIEPRIERDDTDGGAGAGVEVDATGTDLPGEELVDLDDDGLEEMDADLGLGIGDDPGDDGNPLLQQNL